MSVCIIISDYVKTCLLLVMNHFRCAFLFVYIDTKYYQHAADGIYPGRLCHTCKFLQYKNFTNFAEVLT